MLDSLHPSRRLLAATALLALAPVALADPTPPAPSASPFGAGHLIVVRVGDGAATLSSASTAVFLDEFAPTGTHIQTISFPQAAIGGNGPFTNAGSSTSEGFLNWAGNGMYVCNGGYAAAPGTASIAGTTSASVPRVIAVTDLNGNVMTRTALTDAFSGGNIRSVATTNGADYWLAGSNGGVRYATFGSSTSTVISTGTPTNLRVIQIVAGQLYVSSASGSFQGVGTVGTGTPTTSGQTLSLLNGFPTTGTASAYDYYFKNPTTLYVADDRNAPSGGIQKWTESAGTWTLNYTLNVPGSSARGLTGTEVNGQTVLFATTTQSNANFIVRVHDFGASSTFSTVAQAATNTAFRGIRMVPYTCTSVGDCNADNIPDQCAVELGLDTDLNSNTIPDACEQNGGTPFCFGDTGCPCGNNSGAGLMQGCSWGAGGGAQLTGTGLTSVSNDWLAITASNLPFPPGGSSSILFFQGNSRVDMPFNDGKRCAGGAMVRIGIKTFTGTSAVYPEAGDLSISQKGMIPAVGGAYTLQGWYRAFPSLCGNNSNLTNGLSIVWKF